jgi:SanA protein
MNFKRTFKYSAYIILFFVLANLITILVCHWLIESNSDKYVYDSVDEIPYNLSGLLLGTSKHSRYNNKNPYFYNRIKAAAELYKSGKIKYIIVSGDNSKDYYNEPKDMKEALVAEGVPADKIKLDYAGFRTLDAVVRSNEIFSQDSITVISQEFHNRRAVYIAHAKGIHAVAYNADDISYSDLKTDIRELLARVKVFIDLYVIDKQPKFLGEKIDIEQNESANGEADTTKKE